MATPAVHPSQVHWLCSAATRVTRQENRMSAKKKAAACDGWASSGKPEN
eukprot:CAMPEP_0204412574 /NCGR_PEP_ID=MMETSP0470-20130426/15242_1 /ASSEMBLY_ACC=CAM_ASM_000385 /TAXON_ID=2969 /ORGANISM="Oxyrrhis marina" /LENGTH=48 /DNA_ID= /DNA_START= /DNA_END= /DNA_ORIENTATION=